MRAFLRLACLGLLVSLTPRLWASDPTQATITAPAGAVTVGTNQSVSFTATSTDTVDYDVYTVNSYAWTFGDGTTGAGASTSHAYTAAGTYTATLTVSYTGKTCSRMDSSGNCTSYTSHTGTATATRVVTVAAPPVISAFSASASSVEAGKPVTLNWTVANATGLSISGVGTVTGTSVVVTPTAATTYNLTATGPGGVATAAVAVNTYTLSVSISPGSASLLLGGTQAFTGSVNPANQGLSWTATGGSLSGSTFTATASGTATVTVASLEDSTKSATATITVAPVVVAAPVPVPAISQCYSGGTVSFTAQVAGAVDTGVTWSVNGGGSINPASGVFTGSTNGTWTVTATSHADPTKTSTATVQVVPLVVTLTPANPTVRSGDSTAFSASVTGPTTPSQGVTWSVVTPGGGTIVPTTGVYTAPSTPGDYTVKATSTQDGTCFGTAKVHVPGWALQLKREVLYVGAKEVAEVDASGATWVTFDDHLGSPRFEWDGTAVSAPDQVHLIAQKYAPFGEYLNDPATQAKFEKGFTNHEQTDPSGLIYMQARFYAPMYGRFLSPDPARDQHFEQTQSWNIYSYVQNDPIMRVDPTGMFGIKDALRGAWNGIKSTPGRVVAGAKAKVDEVLHHPGKALLHNNGFYVAYSVLKGEVGTVGNAWQTAVHPTYEGGNKLGADLGDRALMALTVAGGEGLAALRTGAVPEAAMAGGAGPAPASPFIDPAAVAGRTPAEIDQLAQGSGLTPKGSDPMAGKGSYVDPVTGQQRVLIHPDADPPHAHVNNPAGQRLDAQGNAVHPESPEAHLPLKKPGQ